MFIDEAQRLTPSEREALLKATERWCGAHIILATSALDRLEIPGSAGTPNSLLSRAQKFQFEYPTREECINGILRVGKSKGLVIDSTVAGWIADRAQYAPRGRLGELHALSNFGADITPRLYRNLYGESPGEPHSQSLDVDDVY